MKKIERLEVDGDTVKFEFDGRGCYRADFKNREKFSTETEIWYDDDYLYIVQIDYSDVWMSITTYDWSVPNPFVVGTAHIGAEEISDLFRDDWLDICVDDMIARLRKYFII